MSTVDLELKGQTISHQHFDYAMTLETETGVKLNIENDYTLHTADASWCDSPEAVCVDSDQPASLINRTISNATSDETGALNISFTDGDRVTVEPDPDYEAWNLAGPDGKKIVCLPGGELATWPAESK